MGRRFATIENGEFEGFVNLELIASFKLLPDGAEILFASGLTARLGPDTADQLAAQLHSQALICPKLPGIPGGQSEEPFVTVDGRPDPFGSDEDITAISWRNAVEDEFGLLDLPVDDQGRLILPALAGKGGVR